MTDKHLSAKFNTVNITTSTPEDSDMRVTEDAGGGS